MEQIVDAVQRRCQNVTKNVPKIEHHVRELRFQVDEDNTNFERMQHRVEKLQSKIALQKSQLEQAVSCFFLLLQFLQLIALISNMLHLTALFPRSN